MTMTRRSSMSNLPTLYSLALIFARATFADARESSKPSSPLLPTADSFRVRNLDEVEPAYALFDGEMYAGLLPMDHEKRTGDLMFWVFEPNRSTVSDSLVIWFNGGPGCSSFGAGLVFENSPVTVPLRPAGYCCTTPDEPLQYNRFSWTNATTMLYLEQPVGTGFARGDPSEPRDETDVAEDFYAWLLNFYEVFPAYQQKRLFLVGESYAGMYVPPMARQIHLENKKVAKQDRVNLAGIALGNGWIDAEVQGPATIDFAFWHGMLDLETRDELHREWEHCIAAFDENATATAKTQKEPAPFHPFNVPDDCGMMGGVLAAAGAGAWPNRPEGPDTYDVTTWDPYIILLGGNTTIDNFYNDPRTIKALHAPTNIKWEGCIDGAGRRRRRLEERQQHSAGRRRLYLEQDRPISVVPYIAELLDEAKIQVLIYSGDRDLSTNAQGSEMLLHSMEWSGQHEWATAKRALWVTDDEPAGYTKAYKGLDFVVVYNSGHLVPYNQPAAALDLITRFVSNMSFADHELPTFDFGYEATKLTTRKHHHVSVEDGGHSPMLLVLMFVAAAAFAVGFVARGTLWRAKRGYQQVTDTLTPPVSQMSSLSV